MDILRTRLYKVNVWQLSLIGQWPYLDGKKQKIHRVLLVLILISVMLIEILKLLEVWSDMDMTIECLTPIGVQTVACIKSINGIINIDKMKRLLDVIKKDWSNITEKDEITILTKFTQQGRKLTLLYAGVLASTTFLYLMVPLVPRVLDIIMPLNETRPHVPPQKTQYYVDPEKYFLPIMFHTYSATVISSTTVVAVDTMFACYVHHACGMFGIVGHRLENLSKIKDISKNDDKCYRNLVLCIEQHCKTIEFASLIESTYSVAYLLTFGMCIVLLSISAVQIVIKLDQYDQMIRLIPFSLAQCNHLLFNSWPGQKLLDHSMSFRESVYFTEWYSFSLRTQQLLRIVMLRTIKPQKITAGKMYEMTIDNFGKVMQTSMSYFMVFASLR